MLTRINIRDILTGVPTGALVGLAFFLAVPSTGLVEKYLGLSLVSVYLLGVLGLLLVGYRPALIWLLTHVSQVQGAWIIVAIVAGLIVAFAIVYPMADAGSFGGGTDREDALNIAARELFHGRYPYRPETYLGNPLNPLPGAVLLSAPFVLMGNAAYQVFFWLPLFLYVMARWFGSVVAALALLLTILLLSPVVLRGIMTGDDMLTNSIYVFLFAFLTVRSATSPGAKPWQTLLLAALLGLGLSSRANFILILPLLFSLLVQMAGLRSAVAYTGVVCLAFIAVTIPFYLWSPGEFSPLHTTGGKLVSSIPLTEVIVPLMGGLMVLGLSLRSMSRDCVVMFLSFALVNAFLVLYLIAVRSLNTGGLTFYVEDVGELFLVFGVFACFTILLTKTEGIRGPG